MRTKVSLFREIRFSYTCAFQGLMKHCLNYAQLVLIHVRVHNFQSFHKIQTHVWAARKKTTLTLEKKLNLLKKVKRESQLSSGSRICIKYI
jgi:hypothetical protein